MEDASAPGIPRSTGRRGSARVRVRRALWAGALLLGAVSAGFVAPKGLPAQGVEALAVECAADQPGAVEPCRDAAMAARELYGGFGLAVSGGGLLAGSGSTLGHRVEGRPRVSMEVGTSASRMAFPDLLDGGSSPVPGRTRTTPALGGGVTVGVYDGFRLLPTVGGVLSVDLVAQGRIASLPRDEGFSSSLASYGAGVRLGLVRESFTLPGVTVSLAHRRMGSLRFGSLLEGDPARLDLDPRSTSLRLVAEKDVLAAGILGGVGLERVSGPVTVRVADEPSDGTTADPTLEGTVDGLRSSRPVFFVGGNLTYLVLRVSAEAGWARSHSPVSGWGERPFEPSAGWFGTLGVRVTY